jgi:dynein heavy chain
LIDIESILQKGGSNELKAFKIQIITKLEKQTEKLLTTYFPSILNIFYQGSKKKEWTTIENVRLESFFRMISLMMCDQIREIIKRTAIDYVALFDPKQIREIPGLENMKGAKFGIKMVLEDSKIKLEPSVTEIQNTVESLLDLIFIAGDKVPKIETQLFVGNNISVGAPAVKQDQCLNICFEQTFPDFCTGIRKKLKKLLQQALESPVLYLYEFDVHKALIARASDVDVTEYLATPKTQESMMEEIRKYRNLASKLLSSLPFSMEFPMVELQCGDFIQSLADRAVGLANRIVDRMAVSYKELNDKIIVQFEQMAKIVQQMPTTVDEMCNLQKFMDSTRLVQMKAMEEQVDEAKKKLNFMITYSELKKEDYDQNSLLFQWPMKIGPIFLDGEQNLIKSRNQNSEELALRREKLQTELETYTKQIDEYYSYGEYSEINKYLKTAQRLQSRLETIGEKIANFNREEDIFGWEITKFSNLSQTIEQLQPFLTLYSTSVELQKQYQLWMTGSFLSLNPEQVEQDVTQMWRNIYKLSVTFKDFQTPLDLANITKEQIEKFKIHLPLITTLCNPGLRERHWKDISQIIGFRFQPDESTSLSSVLERNLSNYMNELEQLSAVATKEYSFEKALAKMYQEWKDVLFVTLEYRDTGTQILGGTEDIQTLLDDHIVKTQTMRGSPFIKAFDEETKIWEAKLVLIQEILDEWLKVQSTWLYLEPIFSSEDIMRQMPSEGKKFVSVNKTWKDIMAYTAIDSHVLRVCDMPDLLAILKDANLNLELIQKGLNQYLEVKRLYFPRFFFLSNDEMLEILSETRLEKLTKGSDKGAASFEKMF